MSPAAVQVTVPDELDRLLAADRRPRTIKSRLALLLFERYPELHAGRDGRKRGCHVEHFGRPTAQANHAAGAAATSYKTLGETYQVSSAYFSILARMREYYDDAKWAKIRAAILTTDTSLSRLNTEFLFGLGLKCPRRPKALRHTQRLQDRFRAALGIRMDYWSQASDKEREAATQVLRELAAPWPASFLQVLSKVIAELKEESE